MATTKRSRPCPDIPTVAESTGIANFDFTLWAGFFGPRGTPMALAANSTPRSTKSLREPEIATQLQKDGTEVAALSIDQFADFVRADTEKYRLIIAEAGLKAD